MALSETEIYKRSPPLGAGFYRMRVDDTVVFIATKASSHSLLHHNLSVFFSVFTIGLIFFVNFGKNRDRDVSLPTRLCTSFKVAELCVSRMAEHLSGLAFIPLWVSMKPKNFPPSTPNTHFAGFNLMLNFQSRPNTSFRSLRCWSNVSDFTTMSST